MLRFHNIFFVFYWQMNQLSIPFYFCNSFWETNDHSIKDENLWYLFGMSVERIYLILFRLISFSFDHYQLNHFNMKSLISCVITNTIYCIWDYQGIKAIFSILCALWHDEAWNSIFTISFSEIHQIQSTNNSTINRNFTFQLTFTWHIKCTWCIYIHKFWVKILT